MKIDRRTLIAGLGGAATVRLMGPEAKADALEAFLSQQLDLAVARAEGSRATHPTTHDMPAKPTLTDFFRYRFAPANHVLQSAGWAVKTGMSEETVFACLMHDVVQGLNKPDHGCWGAQLVEPYVSPKVAFAIRFHAVLRFFPDSAAGYECPDLYRRVWGMDYEPPQYIQEAHRFVRNHKWYMEPRMVIVNDQYAFDARARVSVDNFVDIIGRQFRQPREGLGFDNSPVSHMWRTIAAEPLETASASEPVKPPHLDEVRYFLQTHATEEVSLGQLSELSGLTRFHLCRAFHHQFGLSPHQYQLQLRIDLGRELLVSGSGILETALDLGFSSQSHFTRHFKRIVGVTPDRYRAQFRGRRMPPVLLDSSKTDVPVYTA